MIDEKKLIEKLEEKFSFYEDWIKDNFDGPLYGIDDMFENLLEIVKYQPKVGQWIPCSEKLPKEHEIVLVAYLEYYKQLFNLAYISECGTWLWYFNGTNVRNEIIAWQPLPEPYSSGD